MRKAAAGALTVVALAAAAYFANLRLSTHGNYPSCVSHIPIGVWVGPCGPASRAVWQLPVAVLIASLGVLGAVRLLKRT